MKPFFRLFIWMVLAFVLETSCAALSPMGKANPPSGPEANRPVSNQLLREEIVEYARQYIGIHYRHASTNPELGFDCSGFTHFVMKHFDVNIPTSSSAQSRIGAAIPLKEVLPGDIVIFTRKGAIMHVALVSKVVDGDVYVIHSTNSQGVTETNISRSDYWRPKIYKARDILGEGTASLP